MADLKWLQLTEFYQNQYMGVFEIAQYDLNINFLKNKMADLKWRTLFFKSETKRHQIRYLGFSMSLNTK
jgi:hypothetical protein